MTITKNSQNRFDELSPQQSQIAEQRFSNTSPQQAIRAVLWDTFDRNGGSATMDLVRSEYIRRVNEPFGHLLMWEFDPEQHISELVSNITSGIHLAEHDCNHNWSFIPGGAEKVERLYRYGTRNWGFKSIDQFLHMLDLVTDPLPEVIKESDIELTPMQKYIEELREIRRSL